MKIAIIDDNPQVVAFYARILRDEGHEVLSIGFASAKCPEAQNLDSQQITVYTQDLAVASASIRAYNPDLVFLDHFLSTAVGVNGEAVAKEAQIPEHKIVGISSSEQRYCRWSFGKSKVVKYVPGISPEERDREVFRTFLHHIEQELSPAPS